MGFLIKAFLMPCAVTFWASNELVSQHLFKLSWKRFYWEHLTETLHQSTTFSESFYTENAQFSGCMMIRDSKSIIFPKWEGKPGNNI